MRRRQEEAPVVDEVVDRDAPLVSVVVLNRNGVEHTLACLASLRVLHYPRYEVVVVDNGSTDGSESRIRERHPEATILQTGRNAGFAGGNNVGITHALERGARFVWLVNNDTTVEPGALSALVAEAEKDARVGVVGSAVYHARGPRRVQAWGGGTVGWSLSSVRLEHGTTQPDRLDYVTGASMLVRSEVFEEVGLLDDAFFFYFEDVDLCRRARQRGWKLAVAADSVVHHYVGGTIRSDDLTRSATADRLHARGSGVFIGKHAGPRIVVSAPLKLVGMTMNRVRRGQIDRVTPLALEFARGVATGVRQRSRGATFPRDVHVDDRRDSTGAWSLLARKRLVLDCRWLGLGGAGRVTELLLADFRGKPPPGDWVLWGRTDLVEPLAFRGATIAPWHGDPRALAGQRDLFRVPGGDVVIYLHQIRPLRPGRSVTAIHDTIPVRHGGNAKSRLAKRVFLLAVSRLSTHVLTDSEVSRGCITRDLRVAPERIAVMSFAPDPDRANRIIALRAACGQDDTILYLGRFAPHKNLVRLCRAFTGTAFARAGGRLLLVGGWGAETDEMRAWVAAAGIASVEVRPACSEEEVDALLATSRALVLPSLEEGFGLPAYEAVACGLPVAASRTGALMELPDERAVFFDALDTDDMTRALDRAVSRATTDAVPLGSPLDEVVLATLARAFAGNLGR